MKLETFFEKFELLAEMPGAVGKLRELVLQLAVRGQLAPQDTEDESAETAIKRIIALIDARRSAVPAAEGKLIELTFEIPPAWKLVRFGDLVRIRTGKLDANAAVEGGDFPFFTCSKTPSRISTYSFDTSAVILAGNGDFNLKSYSGKFDAYQRTYVIEPIGWDLGFCYLLMSALIKRITNNQRGSAIPYLRLGDIADPIVPFPPIPEQRRIVAKVDELMTLCDRLEVQQQERETRDTALARASLAQFADAPTPANLQFLFHPSYAVTPADLRKSILTLAVQGKLVPQDPNDEPAERLVTELSRLKTQLLASRRIRYQKVSDYPREDELPFETPAEWKWVRLGQAATLLGGYAYESSAYVPMSSNQIIRLGNVKNDTFLLDQKPAFISEELAEQTAEYSIFEGDILVTMTGTKAKRDYAYTLAVKCTNLSERRLFLNQRVGAIRPFRRELVPLINVFLKSEQLLDLVFATSTGSANQANIGTTSILNLPLPLPPLAEQRRIVAKVEQMMNLVDALEMQLANSRSSGANILSNLRAELDSQ